MIKIEIPMKLPSLNDYINDCKASKFKGGRKKREVEDDMIWFMKKIPSIDKPIKIKFTWIEKNEKRDLDNICFAKKFILDALQKCGKLKNDNRRWVTGFTDEFKLGEGYKVILEIEEV